MAVLLPRDIWELILAKLPRYVVPRLSLCCRQLLQLTRPKLKARLPHLSSLSPTASLFLRVSVDDDTHWLITNITALTISLSPTPQLVLLDPFTRLRSLTITGTQFVEVPPSLSNLERLKGDSFAGEWSAFTRLTYLHWTARCGTTWSSLPCSIRTLRGWNMHVATNLALISHLAALQRFSVAWGDHVQLGTFVSMLEQYFPQLVSLQWLPDNEVSWLPRGCKPSSLRLTHLSCIEARPRVYQWLFSCFTDLHSLQAIACEYDYSRFPDLRALDLRVEYIPLGLPFSLTHLVVDRFLCVTHLTNLVSLEFPLAYLNLLKALPKLRRLHLSETHHRPPLEVVHASFTSLIYLSRLSDFPVLKEISVGRHTTPEGAYPLYVANLQCPSFPSSLLGLSQLEVFRWYGKTFVPGDLRTLEVP